MNIKSIFQSALNPNEISLTVSSAVKVISALVSAYAVIHGVDATPLIDQIKLLADQLVIVATALYTAYHATQMLWGLFRKFAVTTPVQA